MIELISRGGKKIGELSDDVGGSDVLVIKGSKITLEDVYSSEDLTKTFNTQAKELKDAAENIDPARTTG
jgi:hypothetical protein